MCQRGISPSRTPLVKPTRGRPTSAPTRTRNCIAAGQPVVCVNKGPNKGKDSACCNTGFASLLCRNVCGDRDDGNASIVQTLKLIFKFIIKGACKIMGFVCFIYNCWYPPVGEK